MKQVSGSISGRRGAAATMSCLLPGALQSTSYLIGKLLFNFVSVSFTSVNWVFRNIQGDDSQQLVGISMPVTKLKHARRWSDCSEISRLNRNPGGKARHGRCTQPVWPIYVGLNHWSVPSILQWYQLGFHWSMIVQFSNSDIRALPVSNLSAAPVMHGCIPASGGALVGG